MASKLWALAVLVVLVSCSTSDSVDTSLADAPTSTSMSSATTTTSTTTTSMPASTTTATVAPEPPILEVTDPQPDEVVATAVYTFHGVTDPGCTVDVGGKYFAEVDADGNWTIDLVLNPGGNATTFTATDGIGQATTARVTVIYEPPITLEGDGLGIVDFGDPADDALAVLIEAIGPPSEVLRDHEAIADAAWQYSGPTMTDVLAVWDDAGLLVAFSEYPIYREDGVMHMTGWTLTAPSSLPTLPLTEAGIGLGSTFTEVQAAYGDRFVWGDGADDCGPFAMLFLGGKNEWQFRIELWFLELLAGGDTPLVGLSAGISPGC